MADMPSDFWSGWIVVLTVTSLLGLAWAVVSVYFAKNGQNDESVVWDETLLEGSNPAPMWWFWLLFTLMIVSVVYLILYPGLGSFSGALRWSQGGRLEQSLSLYGDDFDSLRAEVAVAPVEVLQDDPMVMASARRIFDQNCAACHGLEAQGQANLFPDLTDEAWQWGGETAQLEQSIRSGRQAVMPPLAAVLGEDGVSQTAQYARALASGETVAEDDPGRMLYAIYCFACHGVDGTGNILLGAPDLTDDIWLYGGDEEALMDGIANGRNGSMPPFQERLDDAQVRMLVAWLTRGGE